MGSLVPGFEHDVFVSYATVDDSPVGDGWVTAFVELLRERLATAYGRHHEHRVWWDRSNIDEETPLTQQISEKVRKSACLVVILSRGYVASTWCRAELKAFLDALKAQPQRDSRIFLIDIGNLREANRPYEFRDIRGRHFWVQPLSTESFDERQTLAAPVPKNHPDYKKFYSEIDGLAKDIFSRITRLRQAFNEGGAGSPAGEALNAAADPSHNSTDVAVRDAPALTESTIAAIEFTLNQPMDDFDEDQFLQTFSSATGIRPSQVQIVSIRQGSTIVRVEGPEDVITNAWELLTRNLPKQTELASATNLLKVTIEIDGSRKELSIERQSINEMVATEAALESPGEFDVFLSHNSKQKSIVRQLLLKLRSLNLVAWYDEEQLRPGMPWMQLLETGINSSKSVAVLVGEDELGPWEDEEMQAALQLAVTEKRAVIPVLLPGCQNKPKLPMFLANRTWVDMRAGFSEESLESLRWGINGERKSRISIAEKSSSSRNKLTHLREMTQRYWLAALLLFGGLLSFVAYSFWPTPTNLTAINVILDELANRVAKIYPKDRPTNENEKVEFEKEVERLKHFRRFGPWSFQVNGIGEKEPYTEGNPPYLIVKAQGTATDFNNNERSVPFEIRIIPKDASKELSEYRSRKIVVYGKIRDADFKDTIIWINEAEIRVQDP